MLEKYKMVSVSSFLAGTMIIIFCLYFSNAINTLPCGTNLVSKLTSNFVHIDFYHLVSNLVGLFALSKIEEKLGAKKFLLLILFLVTITSAIEIVLHKLFKSYPCSIGFSGILFGILTYEITTLHKFDPLLLVPIFTTIFLPSNAEKTSILGHFIGAISGVIAGLLYK